MQRYAVLQELAGPARKARGERPWTFSISVVPGLTHKGAPAWAVVDPRPDPSGHGGTARVLVRDIDATPVPGFDGDAMLELRVTIAHELFHCVVAEALAGATELTIPAEERIVETAAQAMVRCEGLDARVMARAVRALPSALRARVAARAPARARGEMAMAMNIDTVKALLEAIEGKDAEKMAEVCKQLIAEAASGGEAGPPHAEPDGDEPVAKVEPPPAPPPGGGDGTMAQPEARRAKEQIEMDQERARARALNSELEAIVKAARPAAKEGIVLRLRARLGSACTPALEADIMAAADFNAANAIASFAEKHLAGAGGGDGQRARSGVESLHNGGPDRSASFPTVAQLKGEGYADSWLIGYGSALRSGDPGLISAYLEQGKSNPRARIAAPQNGGK